MEKSLFEQNGGTYRQVGDYLLPNITLPEEETVHIGIWGQRHKRYLKQNHRVLYMNLLTSGKLNSYLADIDKQAEDMLFRLVKQMAKREGVTEALKVENQMEWVGQMNNIRNRATELVNAELIYNIDMTNRLPRCFGRRFYFYLISVFQSPWRLQ